MSVLLIACSAVLSGARSFATIGQWAWCSTALILIEAVSKGSRGAAPVPERTGTHGEMVFPTYEERTG